MAVVPSGSITNIYAHYVASDEDGTWYEADHWEEKWNPDYNCPCFYNKETGEMVWTLSRSGSEVRHGSSSWFLPADAACPDLMICDAKPAGAEEQLTEEQPENKWDWEQHWSEQCNKTVYYNLATKHIVFSEESLEPLEKEGSGMFDFDDLPALDGTPQDVVLALEDGPHGAEMERGAGMEHDGSEPSAEYGAGAGALRRGLWEELEAEPSLRRSLEPRVVVEPEARNPRVHEASASTERGEIGACGLAEVEREAETEREARMDREGDESKPLLASPTAVPAILAVPAAAWIEPEEKAAWVEREVQEPLVRGSEASERRSPPTVCCAATGCFKIIKDFARKRSEQGSPSKQPSLADEVEGESLHVQRREQEQPEVPMALPSLPDAGSNGEAQEIGVTGKSGVAASRSDRSQEEWDQAMSGSNGEAQESGVTGKSGVAVRRSDRSQEEWGQAMSGTPVKEEYAPIVARVGMLVGAQPWRPFPDLMCVLARHFEKVDAQSSASQGEASAVDACQPEAAAAARAATTPMRATAKAKSSSADTEAAEASEADWREARTCDDCGAVTADGAPGANEFGDHWYCGTCWRKWVGPMESARVLQRARVVARAKRTWPPVPPTPSTPSWQGGTPRRSPGSAVISEVSSPELAAEAGSPEAAAEAGSPEVDAQAAAEAGSPEVDAQAAAELCSPEVGARAGSPEVLSEASTPERAANGGGGEQEEERAHRFIVPRLPSLQARLMGQVALPPSPLGMLLQSSRSSARKLRGGGRLAEVEAGDYEQVRGAGNELARMLGDRLLRTGEVKASPAGEADEKPSRDSSCQQGQAEEWPLQRAAAEMGA